MGTHFHFFYFACAQSSLEIQSAIAGVSNVTSALRMGQFFHVTYTKRILHSSHLSNGTAPAGLNRDAGFRLCVYLTQYNYVRCSHGVSYNTVNERNFEFLSGAMALE
jgi:hypothetical protein